MSRGDIDAVGLGGGDGGGDERRSEPAREVERAAPERAGLAHEGPREGPARAAARAIEEDARERRGAAAVVRESEGSQRIERGGVFELQRAMKRKREARAQLRWRELRRERAVELERGEVHLARGLLELGERRVLEDADQRDLRRQRGADGAGLVERDAALAPAREDHAHLVGAGLGAEARIGRGAHAAQLDDESRGAALGKAGRDLAGSWRLDQPHRRGQRAVPERASPPPDRARWPAPRRPGMPTLPPPPARARPRRCALRSRRPAARARARGARGARRSRRRPAASSSCAR